MLSSYFVTFLICLTHSIDDFMISYFNSGTRVIPSSPSTLMTRRTVSLEINASGVIFCVILAIILISNAETPGAYRCNQKAIRKAMLEEGALKMKLKVFRCSAGRTDCHHDERRAGAGRR